MWVRTGLAVAVVLLVAAATMTGLALADDGGAESDPASITVPAGRLGDDYSYARFVRNSWEPAWEPTSSWSFRLEDTGTSLDQAGVVHDAVRVIAGRYSWHDALDPLAVTGADQDDVWRTVVDLGTRHIIAMSADWRLIEYAQDPVLRIGAESGTGSFYGPDFYNPFIPAAPPILFSMQGRNLSVGDGMDTASSHALDLEWALRDPNATLEGLEISVAASGVVEGEESLLTRTSGCVSFQLGPEGTATRRLWDQVRAHFGVEPGIIPFLGWLVPIQSHWCFRIDAWWAESTPYPLLVERVLMADNGTWEATLDAVSRRSGGDGAVVPWGVDRAAHHYLEKDAAIELSPPGSLRPARGTATWPPHALEDAIASVEGDATLMGFQSWRQSAPGANVVGVVYRPIGAGECAPRSDLVPYGQELLGWKLLFGVPDGRYYVVVSLDGGSGPTVNCDIQAVDGPEFAWDMLPQDLITFGAVEYRWMEFTHGEGATPNYFLWGMMWACANLINGVCLPDDPRQVYPTENPRGAWDFYSIGSQESDPDDPRQSLFAQIGLRSDNGNYINTGSGESNPIPDVFLGSVGLDSPPEAEPSTAAGARPPPLALAASIAGGLLALAVATYLAPLIRFYVSSGLLWFAGYAKLRKSDLLTNAFRDGLHALIRDEPGISPPELHKRVGGGWSTVVYHLGVLEKNQLVSSLLDGRHKRFFPVDTIDWTKRGQVAALRNANTRRLFETLSNEPGLSQTDVVRRFGRSRATARWHVERLAAAGLVASEKRGHRLLYYAQPIGTSYEAGRAVEVA